MKVNQLFAGLMAAVLLASAPVMAENPGKKVAKTTAKATTYTVDATQSVLNWNGKKVTGEHYGTVNISKGNLIADGGKLTGGTVEIDLRTITSTDLKDNKEYHDKLIGHLKNDDFFGVDKYPTATFKITKVTPKGGNQYDIVGDLTIKGKTAPATFPATVTTSGNTITANGKATIDRTKYDIRYGSKSFFSNIGDKAINDDFTVDMKVVAKK
ncbi:YceI family protein [Tellurirhabdus rosea]|uniref:YceI family protein n=1 Tax=Tellurirhabdus rosea TaxID=2674997 RepID=UPI002251C1B1|nr:YceI family protein [Tellurirhabdus rosea]